MNSMLFLPNTVSGETTNEGEKRVSWKTSVEYLAEYQLKVQRWLYENQPSPFISVEENQEKPNSEIVGNDTVKKAA